MTALVGRAWQWVRSWGGASASGTTTTTVAKSQKHGSGRTGWAAWIWGGWRRQNTPVEEFWEAQEKLQPLEIEIVGAGKPETNRVSSWWNKYLPWPREPNRRTARSDVDGDFSDYGTPPPSPTPATSPFRLFAHSWKVEILPEHYEICFNFLRHLFDLFVVGFLWTVSPPVKLVLEVLGVQGALRLWLHGMAMFFVSTVGMAGLLWLIQEYLPQFALIYGIVQALVISVSVRQSVMLGIGEETGGSDEDSKETEEHKEKLVPGKEQVKSS